jgi:glycosyltransferase involved in cell wall biosynthesis
MTAIHRVTLFASGDSRTAAELVAVCARALRFEREASAAVALHALLIETVFARAERFDLIHCHTDSIHLPLARRCPVPVVTTLHGRLDIRGLDGLPLELHRRNYDAGKYLVFLGRIAPEKRLDRAIAARGCRSRSQRTLPGVECLSD